jgi:Uma2 family endonuclease
MTAFEPLNAAHRLPLTVDAFFLLGEHGAFVDYAKSELIEGDIVVMNAQFRPHAYLKQRLAFALHDALHGTPWSVLTEVTVAMPPHSAPEPDIVVTSEPVGEGAVPLGSVQLLVEVSDSTLATDLGGKAGLYAAKGVPEYWVADVEGRMFYLHAEPSDSGYAVRTECAFGTPLTALTLPEMTIASGDLF